MRSSDKYLIIFAFSFFGNIDKLSIVSRKDIPIFQDEFLKLNKAREMELRSLRKSAIELEEHSALLQNHVDNMESVVADLEQEVELTKVF